jgi:hypothetical protein
MGSTSANIRSVIEVVGWLDPDDLPCVNLIWPVDKGNVIRCYPKGNIRNNIQDRAVMLCSYR